MPLPTAMEDYLKVIHGHTEWQDVPISTTGLAARLGLAASSVTEMVKKLVAQGLVSHVPYGAIELTDEGRAEAVRMVRRHRLIETWLVQRMGYSWDEVHDEAEILEHAVSDRLLDRIDLELGHPLRDPHGDPIPSADGTLNRPHAVLLASLQSGASGVVVRISDRDPVLLRHLEAEGVALDVVLTRTAGGAMMTGAELGAEATSAIWVS